MSKLENGFAVVTVAGTLVLTLSFVAMAVDMGALYSSRTGAQKGVDAAALAGAFTFIANPLSAQPDTAVEHSTRTATSNDVLGEAIQASDVAVTVDLANRRVTVDLSYAQPTYFARILGLNSIPISVRAVAEAASSSTSAGCTKPWFVPNTMLSGSVPCTACGLGEVLVDASGAVTPWAQAQLGFQFTVKPGNPANALAPGNFFALRLPDSQGGNDYRTNIATCAPQAVTCQQFYETEPGNMIGPTRQGVLDLITIHGTVSPDVWVGIGQYQQPDSTITNTSHQLITAVIWDTCDGSLVCTGPPGQQNKLISGKTTIKAIGFAVLFVEGMGGGALPGGGNDVIARLVGLGGCGAGATTGGGGGIDPTEVGPYSFPLRLIRTP